MLDDGPVLWQGAEEVRFNQVFVLLSPTRVALGLEAAIMRQAANRQPTAHLTADRSESMSSISCRIPLAQDERSGGTTRMAYPMIALPPPIFASKVLRPFTILKDHSETFRARKLRRLLSDCLCFFLLEFY